MEKLIAWVAGVAFVIAIWFGVMWCLWSLWSWVLPQVYVGGPKNVVAPGFWLFAACWTLAGFIGRVIFGRRSK